MRTRWLMLVAGAMAVGCAPAVRQNPAQPSAVTTPAVTNAIGMAFVLIQPGTMTVAKFQPVCPVQTTGIDPRGGAPPAGAGSGAGNSSGAGASRGARTPPDPRSRWTDADYARCEEMVRRDASPGFQVTIPEAYYIGKYEVTQAEWMQVMGTNPSVFQGDRLSGDGDRHPVDNVTWDQAQAFVARLNELDSIATYRLPTEFEWEYAARGGSTEDGLAWPAARAQAQTSRVSTLPVGQKEPNGYGLYDVFGNVWEWVEDYYNEKIFPDPMALRTGTTHVLKGASFLGDVKNLTWTTHGAGPANGWDVGFRVVREVR